MKILKNQKSLDKILLIVVLIVALSLPYALKLALGTPIPLAAVESSSMYPTLHVGDVVIITGVSPDDIKIGDIIVFNKVTYSLSSSKTVSLETPIVHRVVKVLNVNGVKYFKTKGDANPVEDRWYVPESAVLGRVLCVNGNPIRIPYIGYVSLFYHEVFGL